MNKLKFLSLASILLASSISTSVQASGTLPFYNNGNALYIRNLPSGPNFGRVDDTIGVKPILGEYRYPTIHKGKFDINSKGIEDIDNFINTSFPVAGRGQTFAYPGQPFYHLVTLDTDKDERNARNIIESEKVTADIVQKIYNGNPNYVLKALPVYNPKGSAGFYGNFYYIRDIAKWSGGYAENTIGDSYDSVNPTRLYIVQTSFPDITVFKTNQSTANVGEPLTFSLEGFEYVSLNRTQVNYSIKIKKDGTTYRTLEGQVNSNKSIKNPAKSEEEEAGKFTVTSTDSWVPSEEGTYTAELQIVDEVYRSKSGPVLSIKIDSSGGDIIVTEPEPKENMPPTASVSTESFYYWPETVSISTIGHDPDGELASELLLVDGQPSSNTWISPRVMEKTPHDVRYMVTDEAGEIAEAMTSFDILPTFPKAETDIIGKLKQNRAVLIDAKASNRVSPVHVAPIDFSKSKWSIKPVSSGLTLSDIKIRPSTDPSIRQLLFKKAGQYELTLTVTNRYGEESEVHTRILDIQPDLKPNARFTVDKSIYTRDKADSKQTTITLTDGSNSPDGDIIDKRIWYVEFDADNDGLFGTPADGGKQVLSTANLTHVVYKTKKVGNYRFSLDVKEKFGEATYEEFVLPNEYLSDQSDVLDSSNRASEYLKVENFNLPNYDKGILVDNIPPIIDFGIKRMNSIEVVLDFGGMDQATLQRKTGSRPGAGVGNGGGGGVYDHYYYTIDENYKNMLTAYASSLETDLRMKGIDATVKLNSKYFQILDSDGECVTNIPVWGWVDYGSYSYSSYSGTSPYSGSWEVTSSSSSPIYSYSSYSGTSPYSGSWEVTSSSSSPIYQYRVTGCVNPKDGSWHNPPCVEKANEVWGNVQVGTNYTASLRLQTGTNYTASLRQWVSNYQFVITSYKNEGCGPDNRPGDPSTDPSGIDQKIDTTDFTQDFNNYVFSSNQKKFYYKMDLNKWTWGANTSKKSLVVNKIKNNNVYFWSNSDNTVRTDAQSLITSTGLEGNYTQYSTEYLQSNIQRLKDYILNRYMIEENPESFTVLVGDELDYTTQYTDFENDPEFQREWKFIHDQTQVNGRIIDNQSSGPIAQSGLYLTAPMQLTEPGTYTVTLRAKDNPLSDLGNDSRFANFRKWSDSEIVRKYVINVHRRPIADFSFNVAAGALALTLNPSLSYDPDHQFNRTDKGIIEYTWEKYVVDGVEYSGKPPVNLAAMKDYLVTLRVKDIDGAYGYVTKIVSTKNINLQPVALFDAPNLVLSNSLLNIVDRSYDPNGDALTNYQLTVKRASDRVTVWTGTSFPTSFSSIGLGSGTYIVGLTVDDIPKYPPSLRSDLFEKTIQVIQNRPPNSCFELSRSAIAPASITCTDGMTSPYNLHVDEPVIYTDKSSDPDNHQLINYTWKIEKLSTLNEVIDSWNIGSPPTDFSLYGVGKYRVTQVVFDNPPAPLPSLSGQISKIYNVIKGPQNPYAMFEYSPLLPISGNNIQLTDRSWDEDGTVVQWLWTIQAPNGTTTAQTTKNPVITNAQVGTYKVTLDVWDDTSPTRLKSKIPAYKEIIVSPAPPNLPPTALFVWDPFIPFLGDTLKLDPDTSFDLDGTITTYTWQIRSKEGVVTNSTNRYPTFLSNSEYFDVNLTVRDDKDATASISQRITVNIAKLIPFVTHTTEWKNYWVGKGFNADVNKFLAGEKFVIQLKTSPANRVEGKIRFPKIGEVMIPSSDFRLVSTTSNEYLWEATLWRDDFVYIPKGEYLFEFTGYHPVNNPTVFSSDFYLIEIVDSIYNSLKFHQSF
jgi:PKD repeat protein